MQNFVTRKEAKLSKSKMIYKCYLERYCDSEEVRELFFGFLSSLESRMEVKVI